MFICFSNFDMDDFLQQLNRYKSEGRFRAIPPSGSAASSINLSSNDYLGLAENRELQREFLSQLSGKEHLFSASSARLLSGNYEAHEKLETVLQTLYNRPILTFNSGYHANVGILPALADKQTLILADKLVHASLIDGIRLSAATVVRFRHNDYAQLEHLLETNTKKYRRIIVATESIFSMDGDEADLPKLVALKRRFPNVMLYLDEAHAVGVRGKNGLGCAEENNCIAEIDLLVGTFGKALASVGAYVVCSEVLRDYLINTARPFIFSTALPPINALWSAFVMERLPALTVERKLLKEKSDLFRQLLNGKGKADISTSHIVPFIVGASDRAVELSAQLREKGFYVLPVRPPTVPEGTARLRFSFSASVKEENIVQLARELQKM